MTTNAITKWGIDHHHSEIGFKIKHLMISTVSGKFKKYEASVETQGDDFSTAKINFSADTASIDTGSEQRDGHIKAADFFDSEKFPQMKFASTKLEKVKDNQYRLSGNFTIRDITKPVQLDVEFGGSAKDPYGNVKAAFIIDGTINRKDWGLNWNVALETGGMLLSDDIKIHCEVQFAKQA